MSERHDDDLVYAQEYAPRQHEAPCCHVNAKHCGSAVSPSRQKEALAHDHAHADHAHHAHVGDGCRADSGARLDELSAPQASAQGTRTAMRIMQMDCPTEEALIRKKLGGMPSVKGVEFNLMQRVLTVTHAPDALDQVLEAIRSLGFQPELPEAGGTPASAKAQKKPLWPLVLAGIAALASEGANWIGTPVWLAASLAILAVALCGVGTYEKGWTAIRNRNLNINALMSIAVTGAFFLGQWPEAAMVMVLFTIAELIEAKSLDRARNAVRGLLQLAPELATVRQSDGRWSDEPAKNVGIGRIVRVRPGERIALDGVVTAGQSSVNQAPITGESLPIDKAVGDSIFAGTINQDGSLEYRVSAEAMQSTLARIIHAIEQAQGARAPTQRFVDRFAKIYTPAVFVFALLIAVVPPLAFGGSWHEWAYRALVLLVIACPCALVISTPVTIVSGLAAAARHGILVKGGVYLEEGYKLRWLSFDKTGTITHGKPELTDTVVLNQAAGCDPVQVATSLAARSDHPVSAALAAAGTRNGLRLVDVADFAAIPGKGVAGTVGGKHYRLGNHRLIHDLGLCSPELEIRLGALEKLGKTVIMLTDNQDVLVMFAVADTVKESSRAAVQALHEAGIRTAMLTGDNVHTAEAIAAQVGIDDARGDLLPEDKLRAIEDYARQGSVGMVGDGINDAPALARADIGFAMGAMGADAAIEAADVALMNDDLRKIAVFVRLSRAARSILVQNIALALGIKAVFLTLTLFGMGTMWMAVFADVGASLLVVGNGLRLLRK